MATKYKVLAPYVTLKVKDLAGSYVLTGFYAGAVLEADQVDEASLRHHLDGDMLVEEGDKLAETFAVPAGTPLPGQPPNVAVTEAGSTAQPVPPLSDAQMELADGQLSDGDRRDGRPTARSSKDDWVEHAVTRRADGTSEDDARAEAQGMSKAELVAKFGG